jgi:hypothetical protein
LFRRGLTECSTLSRKPVAARALPSISCRFDTTRHH